MKGVSEVTDKGTGKRLVFTDLKSLYIESEKNNQLLKEENARLQNSVELLKTELANASTSPENQNSADLIRFRKAILNGQVQIVKELLESGKVNPAELCLIDDEGDTALMIAAKCGQYTVVEAL